VIRAPGHLAVQPAPRHRTFATRRMRDRYRLWPLSDSPGPDATGSWAAPNNNSLD
jgi:hypothetical protein